jgi:hypothetical protein
MGNDTLDPEDDRAAEAVEEALEAFRDLLTPGDIAESRELLLDVLAAHPVGRLLAERVRDRRRVLNSCEHPTMAAPLNGKSHAASSTAGPATDLPETSATEGRDKAGGSR